MESRDSDVAQNLRVLEGRFMTMAAVSLHDASLQDAKIFWNQSPGDSPRALMICPLGTGEGGFEAIHNGYMIS